MMHEKIGPYQSSGAQSNPVCAAVVSPSVLPLRRRTGPSGNMTRPIPRTADPGRLAEGA